MNSEKTIEMGIRITKFEKKYHGNSLFKANKSENIVIR